MDPCTIDDRLYDAIYGNVANVPGYSRYHTLAEKLPKVRNPLDYIARTEDCYFAVAKTLSERVSDKSRTTICEVGCGQGYLTYALVDAGYACTGVDISGNAVALARRRFGDHYFCGTIGDFCQRYARPDVIVATELIEHLENPVQFVDALLAAVENDGLVILTTPNKAACGDRMWDTELPPVHLWWFTKAGMAAIAGRVNCSIDFIDLTDFYRRNRQFGSNKSVDRKPVFSENYELIQHETSEGPWRRTKRSLRQILPAAVMRKIQSLRSEAENVDFIDNTNSPTIAGIFTRKVR